MRLDRYRSRRAERGRQIGRFANILALFTLIGSAIAFVIGSLNDVKAVSRDVGLLGICIICVTVTSLVLFSWSAKRASTVYEVRGQLQSPQIALTGSLLLVSLIGLVFSALILYKYFRPPDLPKIPELHPSPASTPACYYLDKSDGSFQDKDIDVGIVPGGYVRQVFTASGTQLTAVSAIISRERRKPADTFPEDAIGKVRLLVTKLDQDGADLETVPIAELDSGAALDPQGIVVSAGPNHKDTIVELRTENLEPGARYAFIFINEEPNAVLAFSLRPRGKGDPITLSGEIGRNGTRTLENRALAGFACDAVP